MFGESTLAIHHSGRLYGASRDAKDAGNSHNLMKTGEEKMNSSQSSPNDQRVYAFGSLLPGGAHYLLGDGRVKFITEEDRRGALASSGCRVGLATERGLWREREIDDSLKSV
ncbi:MAG: DUF1559 domain-containing protein [Planctomycetes bacterium]|nr:DUF1559 domain-containing protein [Planctomycetota bacterium]